MRIPMADLLARHPFAGDILRRLRQAGHEAVIVGGAVRDLLLAARARESEVPDDVDIATSAPPDLIRGLFSDHKVLAVGESFGVMVVVAPDGRQYEVATFRTEAGYTDRRRPDWVRWGTLAEDVRRRDFTVNGLAATLEGEVLDLVGGLDDLAAGLIRTIGDPRARLSEDYLRMLRAVRLACQLGFAIEERTAAAVRSQAGQISCISWERIRDELLRVLATPRSHQGLLLLADLGLLAHVLPEVQALQGVPQPPQYHPEGDVFEHTVLAVAVADRLALDPVVKLAVLFHDVGKPAALTRAGGQHTGGHEAVGSELTAAALRRLRLPARDVGRVCFLVSEHMRLGRLPDMGMGKQVRLLGVGEQEDAPYEDLPGRFPDFADLLRLFICDAEASAHRAAAWRPLLSHTVRLLLHVRRVQGMRRARQLITGHDLLALGEPPGPRLGRVLSAVHERILAGEVVTRDEALALAARLLKGQT
ncbi:MAG: CCA tRNA nucleotidyltransferase [Candidatus Bipolaricaulaceae bacterium]